MDTPPILQARGLEKTVRGNDLFDSHLKKTLWKVEALSLETPGLTVLAGRNGAGKSTLVRCLLGHIRPSRGDVRWYGQAGVRPQQVGYVPEFPILSPALKVGRYLELLLGKGPGELARMRERLASYPSLAIEPFLDVPATKLSKGQQQRIQLWAALSHEPRGLVLDEPFSGLDPWARAELSGLLVNLLDEGRFILMATHELTRALRERAQQSWIVENGTVNASRGCALPE